MIMHSMHYVETNLSCNPMSSTFRTLKQKKKCFQNTIFFYCSWNGNGWVYNQNSSNELRKVLKIILRVHLESFLRTFKDSLVWQPFIPLQNFYYWNSLRVLFVRSKDLVSAHHNKITHRMINISTNLPWNLNRLNSILLK